MREHRQGVTQFYCFSLLVCTGIWLTISFFNIQIPPYFVIGLFAFAIAFLGVPHGALDAFLIHQHCIKRSLMYVIACYFVYLAIAMLGVFLWFRYPFLSLCLFLIVSIYHFSCDWRKQLTYLPRLAIAASIICSPTIFYSSDIAQIFNVLMLSVAQTKLLIDAMIATSVVSNMFLVARFIGFYKRNSIDSSHVEIIALICSAIVLPPLLHFVLYFCFLHSLKHILDYAKDSKKPMLYTFGISLPVVLLTISLAMLIPLLMPAKTLEADTLRLIFIALFGLTMAHMFVVVRWHKTGA